MVKAYDFGIEVKAGVVSIPDSIYLKDMDRFVSELQRAQKEAEDPIKEELERLVFIGHSAYVYAEDHGGSGCKCSEARVKAIRSAVLESVQERFKTDQARFQADGFGSHGKCMSLAEAHIRDMQWPED